MTKLDIELLGFSSSLSSSHFSGFLWKRTLTSRILKEHRAPRHQGSTKFTSIRSMCKALDLMTVRYCKNSGDREGADLIQAEAKIRLFGLVLMLKF